MKEPHVQDMGVMNQGARRPAKTTLAKTNDKSKPKDTVYWPNKKNLSYSYTHTIRPYKGVISSQDFTVIKPQKWTNQRYGFLP